MRILAIDYGKKKIGLSLATSMIAQPYKVIRYDSEREVLEKIAKILQKEDVEEIVLGESEGKMGKESRKFGKKLAVQFNLPVHFQDETLTTHEAQELSLKAGIGRKKRKQFEDAYSATLILQSYLEAE
ncbi:MAG: Holliday junction resolvase RuvX [Microgenomates group bacterium]